MMLRFVLAVASLAVAVAAPSAAPAPHASSHTDAATAVVDTAIARMGGSTVLRGIKTVRYHMAIQWLNTTFDARPYNDNPGYELDTDYRDYTTHTWRNERRFPTGSSWLQYLDLVIDTVAARQAEHQTVSIPTPVGVIDGWAPLDIAYIDERRELFALTPDRLVLALRDAKDLTARADSTIAGVRHAVVSATVEGYPMTAYFRRTDGLLTLARYHADESNDYGLAPWGPMNVDVWYSTWSLDPSSRVFMPMDWSIIRLGRPYKRMSVLDVVFDSTMSPDSLRLSDAVRQGYLTGARKAMADLPYDSARLSTDGRMASFRTAGAPRTAIKIGDEWLLVEPGNLPLNAERASTWLAAHDNGARVAGAIVAREWASGGAAWVAKSKLPIYAAPGAVDALRASLANFGAPATAVDRIATGKWIHVGKVARDSMWAEPIDFPNAPQALLVYVPSSQWVYSSGASDPLDMEIMKQRIASRGWSVKHLGSLRSPAGVSL